MLSCTLVSFDGVYSGMRDAARTLGRDLVNTGGLADVVRELRLLPDASD